MNSTSKMSKSAVMKRAWLIYKKHRDMFPTFGVALSRAWRVEKENMEYRKQQEAAMNWNKPSVYYRNTKMTEEQEKTIKDIHYATMASYYNNGVYSGD